MNSATFSKFDSQIACEEIHGFIPSAEELAESLPYLNGSLLAARDRNYILRQEADIRGEAFLMAD